MKIVAIILARGNSQGIPKKNLISFCGKPLLYWSIKQAKNVKAISDVWVSSDNEEILEFSKKHGAKTIRRPNNISKNTSTSESGYLHAISEIENHSGKIDLVVNTSDGLSSTKDSFSLRRATLINKVPYCTNMSTAYACLEGIQALKTKKIKVKPIQES